jgi:hypothetical protein
LGITCGKSKSFCENLRTSIGERSRYRELDKEGWEYLWHNQVSSKSGDLAFMKLLTREGWGFPLMEKLPNLKVPTRIIFGETGFE